MTFRKRLATLFVVVIVVPVATLTGILLLVSSDARDTEADASLNTGLHVARAVYSAAVQEAKESATAIASSPRLAAAVEREDRGAVAAIVSAAARSNPGLSVSVFSSRRVPLTAAGDPFVIGLAGAAGPDGRFMVEVGRLSAGALVKRLERITGLRAAVYDGEARLAGLASDPHGIPPPRDSGSVVVDGAETRARTDALDGVRNIRVTMFAPAGLSGFSLSSQALALLAVFVLAVLAIAGSLAFELYGQHSRLRVQAARDPLTGLWNRRQLRRTLEREEARAERYGQHLSLLILDVDGFKEINDTHGHPAGDAVLERLAELIRAETRSIDEGARYGGDEMALVLPETGRAGAKILAERLRRRVGAQLGDVAGDVTISVGVATIPECAEDVESLIESADSALLEAKRAGRDRVCAAPIVSPARPRPVAASRERGSDVAGAGGRGRYTRRRGE